MTTKHSQVCEHPGCSSTDTHEVDFGSHVAYLCDVHDLLYQVEGELAWLQGRMRTFGYFSTLTLEHPKGGRLEMREILRVADLAHDHLCQERNRLEEAAEMEERLLRGE